MFSKTQCFNPRQGDSGRGAVPVLELLALAASSFLRSESRGKFPQVTRFLGGLRTCSEGACANQGRIDSRQVTSALSIVYEEP